tara:strand:+ start:9380 stop:10441 length:1062 start_codon:yes stop_codon:yes gene_type:complete
MLLTLALLQLNLEPVVEGLNSPIHATAIQSDPLALYIAERKGRILRLQGKNLSLILDISDKIDTKSERGLLAIAFPPNAKNADTLFAHYSDEKGTTHLSKFEIDLQGNRETILFTQKQPWANHNGGQICFGPDDALYLGLGDGGAANDPHDNGQNRETYLGGIIRFDLTQKEVRPELWHWGLRNPWRFSFDQKTGDLWIGDVGQNKWEEIDFASVSEKHLNFGWRWREGQHDFKPAKSTDQDAPWRATLREPAWEYAQGGTPRSCSVTGGFVYRGKKLGDSLQGHYFFGDWASGVVWSGKPTLKEGATILTDIKEHPKLNLGFGLASFAEDENGEIYLINMPEGSISRLIIDS